MSAASCGDSTIRTLTFEVLFISRIILCEPRVTHQVIDLIGQLHLLIRILQSFVIILKHRSGVFEQSSSVWLSADHTQLSHLFNDLHLFFSPLWFVLLCIDKELNDLLLQLVSGVWMDTTTEMF